MPEADPGATPDGTNNAGSGAGGTSNAPPADDAAALLAAFKEAGIEKPAVALETIQKLREYERGTKLPDQVSKELDELRAKVKEAEDAKKTDLEKLQGDLAASESARTEAETRVQEVTLRFATAEEGRKAGALYPADLWMLIDRAKVEFDKTGEPTNLEKVVGELKTARPGLFSTPRGGSFDGGARGNAPAEKDMNALLREKAGRR